MVIPGLAHHVTHRGDNRQDVFFVEGDRQAYRDVLRVQCAKFGVRALRYCPMTNHMRPHRHTRASGYPAQRAIPA